MNPGTNVYYVVVLLLLLLWLTIGTWVGMKAIYKQWRQHRAMRHGLKMEENAPKILQKMGFTHIREQVEYRYQLPIGGEGSVTIYLKPDFVAEKYGKTYVIDSKTGHAARPQTSSSRRQLLEYACFIPCDGVLLLDMDQQRIYPLQFPLSTLVTPAHTRHTHSYLYGIVFVAGMAAGVAGCLLW